MAEASSARTSASAAARASASRSLTRGSCAPVKAWSKRRTRSSLDRSSIDLAPVRGCRNLDTLLDDFLQLGLKPVDAFAEGSILPFKSGRRLLTPRLVR